MTTKKSASAKKEKGFHPSSRKAGQLARKAIRQSKISNIVNDRHKRHNATVDLYGFFYHAIPPEGVLTLDDLHEIVRDVWLTRFDEELECHRSARRSGRPKSTKEMKLEEVKLREAETYRTGMEVIDLTHPPTVEFFRKWDQKEVAYIQLLRFIRIFSTNPNLVVISRPGKHASIIGSSNQRSGGVDIPMDTNAESL